MFKIGQVRFTSFQHLLTVFIRADNYIKKKKSVNKKGKKKKKMREKERTRRFTIK